MNEINLYTPLVPKQAESCFKFNSWSYNKRMKAAVLLTVTTVATGAITTAILTYSGVQALSSKNRKTADLAFGITCLTFSSLAVIGMLAIGIFAIKKLKQSQLIASKNIHQSIYQKLAYAFFQNEIEDKRFLLPRLNHIFNNFENKALLNEWMQIKGYTTLDQATNYFCRSLPKGCCAGYSLEVLNLSLADPNRSSSKIARMVNHDRVIQYTVAYSMIWKTSRANLRDAQNIRHELNNEVMKNLNLDLNRYKFSSSDFYVDLSKTTSSKALELSFHDFANINMIVEMNGFFSIIDEANSKVHAIFYQIQSKRIHSQRLRFHDYGFYESSSYETFFAQLFQHLKTHYPTYNLLQMSSLNDKDSCKLFMQALHDHSSDLR